MMASLKINFENLRKGALKEVFEALEKAFPAFGIDFYIIGAFARDIWLDGNPYLPPMRATLDLDIAIYVGKMAQYQDLKNYLQTTFGLFFSIIPTFILRSFLKNNSGISWLKKI